MAQVKNLKKLIKEDFDPKYQDLIDKLAFSLNPLMEQLVSAFNKNINNDNLSRQNITLTVSVDSTGKPTSSIQIKTSLASKIIGLNVIKAENQVDSTVYPTAAVWVSWSINGNILTISNIRGIQANNKYNLTLELIS